MKIVRQTVEYPSVFGKLGDREFKKAVVICLYYKLSAVGQYIFVLLKEAPVCKASLRVACLRPRIAEIEKYSGNGIRLENFGNLRGVSVYKAKILRKASGHSRGALHCEQNHIGDKLHCDEIAVRVPQSGFGDEFALSAADFEA